MPAPSSPVSPSTPPEPVPSPWDEDEGAMEAEDRYLIYLEGPESCTLN